MLALLIAQTTILLSPLPGGAYTGSIYHNVPVQTQIPPAVRLLQNAAIGNPAIRSQYEFPDANNGYPLRTTRYGQPLVPIQEQLAMQQLQNQQQREQLEVSGQQLNQALAQKKDLYDTRVNQQALQATQQLGDFDPQSPDFEAKFTQFQKANPLAFQNPGFRQLASQLLQTRQQHVHTDEAASHALAAHQATTQVQQDMLKQHSVNSTRAEAAKYGEDALAAYDAALQGNGNDPYAALAFSQRQISKSKDEAMTQKADNKPITLENYNAMLLRQHNLLGNGKKDYADLNQDEKTRYDFLENNIRAYEDGKNEKSATATPAKQPVSFFLPKPLSTPTPTGK